MRLVHDDQRARHRKSKRARLAALSTAFELRLHIVATESIRGCERLLNRRHERRTREVIAERATVHIPLAGAGADVEAADRFFPAADRMRNPFGHYLLSL